MAVNAIHFAWADLPSFAPVIVLVFGGLLLLLLEAASQGRVRGHLPWVTAGIALLCAAAAFLPEASPALQGGGVAVFDGFARFFSLVIALCLGLSALGASSYLRDRGLERGEFYGLASLSAAGMIMLSMAVEFITLFISLEVMSIAIYALVAFRRDEARSVEAAVKYLVLGAFSSAIFLYGVALLYVATGSFSFHAIAMAGRAGVTPPFAIGATLVLVGLCFKVAAVPFHMWTPDVYEGAPTPVTAFMAAGVKAAAFAALLRFVFVALGTPELTVGSFGWGPVLYWLAMLTIVVGNLLALVQDNVKRMLAYSSIAHAGYALLAVVASAFGGPTLSASVLFYLLVYALTSIGAFSVVSVVERLHSSEAEGTGQLASFAGLAKRRGGLAFAMTVFMFSLAGVPPTGGFIAKLDVFRALFQASIKSPGEQSSLYVLAVVSILMSLLGAYYYLRVVVFMYMKEAPDEAASVEGTAAAAVPDRGLTHAFGTGLILTTLAVLLLGVLPGKVNSFAQRSIQDSHFGASTQILNRD